MTKQRRGIQRREAPDNTRQTISADNGNEHVMTKEEFAKWKPTLMRILRRSGDPPPRVLVHGKNHVDSDRQYTSNLCTLLRKSADRGSVLVRGYKLTHIQFKPTDRWGFWSGDNAWKATFYMVIAHPPSEEGSDKWVYEDPNMPADNEDIGKPYIFVPSSRAHAELDDEQVLSNKWVMGKVLGGNAHFCRIVIADQKLRGRRKSVIGMTPEEVVSKRAQKCYFLTGFQTWHRIREISDPIACVAEQFGFPVVDIDQSLDLQNLKAIKFGVANNQDAMVDGYKSLSLHVSVSSAFGSGAMLATEMEDLFFEHYDEQYALLQKRQSDAMDKALAEMGYMAQGSGQSLC